MISTRAHQAEEALTSGPCPESRSQGVQDPLSHFKSSWEGLVSWSQHCRKGTRSTLEVTRLAQGNRGDHSWGRWLRGPLVGHWVGGEEGQLLTLPWASWGSEPLVPPLLTLLLPPFPAPSLFQVFWPRTDPAAYGCVHTSSLGLTWAFWLLYIVYKCNSPEFQTHRPTVWPGLCFCKDQSCILGLFIKNLMCRHDTWQRKEY